MDGTFYHFTGHICHTQESYAIMHNICTALSLFLQLQRTSELYLSHRLGQRRAQ